MIVSAKEAYDWYSKQNVVFVDCRFDLQDVTKGKEDYAAEHLPGAIHMDLEEDLSGEVKETGGRHPLPDLQLFMEKLMKAGIDSQTIVVAYDQNHAFASRFIWMLKVIGHQEAYVLNGGFSAWKAEDYDTTNEIPETQEVKVKPSWYLQDSLIATQADVQSYIKDQTITLIDSRNNERYCGQHEPVDQKAGHIPKAINYNWSDLFEAGFFKKDLQLQKHFEDLNHDTHIVVYCGSGVTAAPNVIGLWQAGYIKVQLYVGSFSDWITNDANQVITGNQPE